MGMADRMPVLRRWIMEQKLEPFVRHGTEEEPIQVQADDPLRTLIEDVSIVNGQG